jgi:hypothetical protein
VDREIEKKSTIFFPLLIFNSSSICLWAKLDSSSAVAGLNSKPAAIRLIS